MHGPSRLPTVARRVSSCAAALGLLASGLTATAVAGGGVPAAIEGGIPRTPDGLVDNRYATTRGCTGHYDEKLGHIFGTAGPHWVSVQSAPVVAEGILYNKGKTRKAAVGGGTAPELGSLVSYEDTPFDHDSHDWNGHVALDPAYKGLLSNHTHELTDGVTGGRLFELEWEVNDFPKEYWPIEGDRITVMGRWIFDCGHPGGGYTTEIHPAQMVAATRQEGHIFRGDTAPSLANITRMFINGQGGYYNARAGGSDYSVDIDVPNKPSADAVLKYQIVSQSFGSSPAATLTPIPAVNPTKIRLTLPLSSVAASTTLKRAVIAAVGWSEPVLTREYRAYTVTLDKVKVLHDHDPGCIPFDCFDGEWKLWFFVGNTWVKFSDSFDDGDSKTIAKDIRLLMAIRFDPSHPTTPIPRVEAWLEATGWENDCDSAFGGSKAEALKCVGELNNDEIGAIRRTLDFSFPGRSRTVGSSFFTGGGSLTFIQRDYEVTYHVRQTARYAPGWVQ